MISSIFSIHFNWQDPMFLDKQLTEEEKAHLSSLGSDEIQKKVSSLMGHDNL